MWHFKIITVHVAGAACKPSHHKGTTVWSKLRNTNCVHRCPLPNVQCLLLTTWAKTPKDCCLTVTVFLSQADGLRTFRNKVLKKCMRKWGEVQLYLSAYCSPFPQLNCDNQRLEHSHFTFWRRKRQIWKVDAWWAFWSHLYWGHTWSFLKLDHIEMLWYTRTATRR